MDRVKNDDAGQRATEEREPTPQTDALVKQIIERRKLENRTAARFLKPHDPQPSDVMDIPQSLIEHARRLEAKLAKLHREYNALAARSETATVEVAGVDVATLTIPLEHARLIRRGCLPHNPNKCRQWDQDLLAAVRSFIAAVEARCNVGR